MPVSITPLNRDNLKGIFERPKMDLESTDFSISRFIVPYLCRYEGWAVFMDCDMVCLGDVAELERYVSDQVSVVKHDYIPRVQRKFLGSVQTKYEKKNWSSVMVFNNGLCGALTPEYVHKASGLELHQFKWADRIGNIPKVWNHLVGEENQCLVEEAKLLHYTQGTPCFASYRNCESSEIWRRELEDMKGHDEFRSVRLHSAVNPMGA